MTSHRPSSATRTILFILAVCAALLSGCQSNGAMTTIPFPAATDAPLPAQTTTRLSRAESMQALTPWISYTNGNDVSKIITGPDGSLWTAGRGGVVMWSAGDKTYKKYTASNGLPENDITALAFGPDHKLWAGTHDGQLAFLDAGKWTTLDPKIADTISDLAVATDGTVWAGTNTGVHGFDGTSWQVYTTAQGLLENNVLSLEVASNGTLWAATKGGVSSFHNGVWLSHLFDERPLVNAITEAPDHSFWFGAERFVIHFDGQTWTRYALGEEAGTILAIAASPQGVIWLATTRLGLLAFDPARQTLADYNNLNAASLSLGPDGSLWLGDYFSGLSHLTATGLETFTTQDANISNSVNALAAAPDGTLWAASTKGVAKYDGQAWASFTTHDGLLNDGVLAVAITPDNTPWFGTEQGLSHFDGTTWINFTTQNGLVDKRAGTAQVTADGTVWLATKSGLSWYNGQGWNSAIPLESFADSTITRAIAAGPDGAVWIGTKNGVARFDGQRWVPISFPFRGTISSLAISTQGSLWIGTLESGIYYIDGSLWNSIPKDVVQSLAITPEGLSYTINDLVGSGQGLNVQGQFLFGYTREQGLPGSQINAIRIDSDGNPWIATEGGVAHLTPTGWVTYQAKDGLGDQTIQALTIDPSGNIWAGTALGGLAELILQQ